MEFDKETLKPTYRMVIGEAGESCAFYIAEKLGMPQHMLKTAARAAYGGNAPARYLCEKSTESGNSAAADKKNSGSAADTGKKSAERAQHNKPSRMKQTKKPRPAGNLAEKYRIGDSVTLLPDKKIGIVCRPINEKGVLLVQLPDKKIWISHKRVKLHVAASELYPGDYDFSIIFDTVENRKIRHEMERKYTDREIHRSQDN